ncbi:hypothetical protein M501DRAFT_990746 [Patellaria atrata CBS 101060]|uniref:Uncharacterized protein n=1 Tax=Patellaria atrata CBS 101060 TaxID=1346257 RepID=A0A9P4SE62_9PEZI|nr:hypothetical protein M501DRAFT_990746 [Patellaria atrata CBS 101060]
MANEFCCTHPERTDSPIIPNARIRRDTDVQEQLLNSLSTRHTSAGPEELRQIQRILEGASLEDTSNPPSMFRRKSKKSMTDRSQASTPESKGFKGLLRKRLSWMSTKSTSGLRKKRQSEDDNHLLRTSIERSNTVKREIRMNLLSDQSATSGGYDSDAEDISHRLATAFSDKNRLDQAQLVSIQLGDQTHAENSPNLGSMNRNLNLEQTAIDKEISASRIGMPNAEIEPEDGSLQELPLLLTSASLPDLLLRMSGDTLQRRRSRSESGLTALPKFLVTPLRPPNSESGIKSQPADSFAESALGAIPAREGPTSAGTVSSQPGSLLSDCLAALSNSEDGGSNRQEMRVLRKGNIIENQLENSQEFDDEGGDTVHAMDPSRTRSITSSVHLYSMRISQHLRSPSAISVTSSSYSPRPLRNRHRASNSNNMPGATSWARHNRQTSSTGFGSANVPSSWGNVVKDDASSIYSSRPQSPLESFGPAKMSISTALTDSTSRPVAASHLDKSEREIMRIPHITIQNPSIHTPRAEHDPFVDSGGLKDDSSPSNNSEATIHASNILLESLQSSPSAGKSTKFKEELGEPRKRARKRSSMRLPSFKKLRSRSSTLFKEKSISALDGPTDDRSRRRLSHNIWSLGNEHDQPAEMWERALKAQEQEKSALFVSGNKDRVNFTSPFRERSGSVVTRPYVRQSISEAGPFQQTLSPPSEARQTRSMGTLREQDELSPDAIELEPQLKKKKPVASRKVESFSDLTSALRAWGRYPSHTREERNASAGEKDNIITRDFAFEIADESPTGTKRKRKGKTGLSKSQSMTFGRTFLKNYARIFRSQSSDFRAYGHGHRSSISTGGQVEFPELELLPSVMSMPISATQTHLATPPPTSMSEAINLWQTPTRGPRQRSASICSDVPPPFASGALETSDEGPGPLDGTLDREDGERNAVKLSRMYESLLHNHADDLSSVTTIRPQKRSNTSKSLPGLMSDETDHFRQTSIASGNSLRRSTVDLAKLLQDTMEAEREKALRMAEAFGRD